MTTVLSLWNGSAFVDVTDTLIYSFEYIDGGSKMLNELTATFNKAILDEAVKPSYQNDIKITIDGTDIFAGKIDEPISEFPLHTVQCFSYGEEFLDKYVQEVFTNVSPEYIFEYIITNYTSLTYVAGPATGITISRIVFRDKRISEVFQILCDLLDYQFRSTTSKQAYFEPRAATDSGVTLTVKGNIINKPTWSYNPDFIVTQLIIEGDKQAFSNSESFVATASQTVFTLAYEPFGNINVTDNGTRMTPFINGTGDYIVSPESKTITFSSGRTVGHTIVVSYEFQIPVKITVPSTTYDSYGELVVKERKIVNKAIKSFADARAFAAKYLTLHSTPAKKSDNLLYYGFDSRIRTGVRITVIDDEEPTPINESLVVLGVKYTYPDHMMEIKVGTVESLYFDWQKEVIERLRDLAQNNTNSEKLQYYFPILENMSIVMDDTYTLSYKTMNDTFIASHGTLGYARASASIEPDCSTSGATGTWTGTPSYSTSGARLSCATFNGSSTYISSGTISLAGIVAISMFVKSNTNSRDILYINSANRIQVDGSGNIVTTGFSGASVTTTTVGTFKHVYVSFSSLTITDVKCGFAVTYFDGQVDELMLFNTTLSAQDRLDIQQKNFYTNHSKYTNCKLWWSMDNPTAGDKRGALTTLETG